VNRIAHLILGVGLALAYPVCAAADPCPPTRSDKTWSSACFVTDEAGERRVRPEYVKRFTASRQGVALIMVSDTPELLAVDKAGKVVIPGIRHTGDFDFPSPREGLGRFDAIVKGGGSKCGYFNARTMKVTIPAQYDQCDHFEGGVADVCNECSRHCTESECQNSIFLGGKGIKINRKGVALKRSILPTFDEACSELFIAKINRGSQWYDNLGCDRDER
jgi:hypothetical protein